MIYSIFPANQSHVVKLLGNMKSVENVDEKPQD